MLRQELERPVEPIRWVVYGPRVVDGEIHRVVSYVPGWAEVQTWRDGEWWDGGHLVEVVRCTPPTPTEELLALGLPEEQMEPGFCDDHAPKHGTLPEPLSARTSDEPAVKVIAGPNVVGRRCCRIVLTQDGKAVREEWWSDGWYRTRGYIGAAALLPTHLLGNAFFSVTGFFADELNATLANMLSKHLAEALLLALLKSLNAPIRAHAHDPRWLDLMVYSNYQDAHKVVSTVDA